jgi:hypothetical protein
MKTASWPLSSRPWTVRSGPMGRPVSICNKCMSKDFGNLHAKILHQLDLEVDDVDGKAVLGDFGRAEAAKKIVLLKDGDIRVAEARKECRTRD